MEKFRVGFGYKLHLGESEYFNSALIVQVEKQERLLFSISKSCSYFKISYSSTSGSRYQFEYVQARISFSTFIAG